MAVNLVVPEKAHIPVVPGIALGYAEAGIKKAGRKDVLLIELAPGTSVAGVFTQNRFCAAPVQICRSHLAEGNAIRALIVNTGNANAGTGESGLRDAYQVCEWVAERLNINKNQVLPFSTGVILEPLPIEKIAAVLPAAQQSLRHDHWFEAAHAIMTTDTLPKIAYLQTTIDGVPITITGISKGAGMIKPNMATMLGFIGTDAAITPELLQTLTAEAAGRTFNRITVDGDTSTNDSFVVMATGQAPMSCITQPDDPRYVALLAAIESVARELAINIVRDGEGATKLITITVEQGQSVEECAKVAYAIAHSPLVKTAFFASDPNLGRILAAIGYAGISDLNVNGVSVYLDDVLVAEKGGRATTYHEAQGAKVMKQSEIMIRVVLGRGDLSTTVWTTDLSYEYVKVNADYRS